MAAAAQGAAPDAKAAKVAGKKKAKVERRGPPLLLIGLAGGAVITLATPTALLAFVLFAPTLLAWLVDPREGRPVARPILLCALAASMGPLVSLWRGHHELDESLALVTDAGVLGFAWVAQGFGWLMAELLPVLVRLTLDAKSATRAAVLRSSRARHEAEWGLAPRRRD